ncbi:MAG: hypothetical protein KKC21_01740 [Nitrospinae bacterium]|nr:hypothetical protein [Nitrospinota bacterium]
MSKKIIADESGKKKCVVQNHGKLTKEDIHDLAVFEERKNEPTISFDKLKAKLKSDGLI